METRHSSKLLDVMTHSDYKQARKLLVARQTKDSLVLEDAVKHLVEAAGVSKDVGTAL